MWHLSRPAEGREPLEFFKNSSHEKKCPFELALSALVWRISLVYSSSIVVDLFRPSRSLSKFKCPIRTADLTYVLELDRFWLSNMTSCMTREPLTFGEKSI
jgi:hypothetical protein